jgi:glycosyltransferase involved in cell wall biosynthesis
LRTFAFAGGLPFVLSWHYCLGMLVGVCDFPARYAFPPTGYAGIERWLWAVAVGARRVGATVHLLGERWRPELAADWCIDRIRLEDVSDGPQLAQLRAVGYDLLVAWHEYPARPTWRRVWEILGCDVATFQHGTNRRHPVGTFDGVSARLYCYSPEMMALYAADHPRAELAVHQGLGEDEPPAVDGRDLVWIGRIDADKAPHLAVLAAKRLARRIRVVGPIFDAAYLERYRSLFFSPDVELVGEVGGAAKTVEFHRAKVFIYTCARTYVEAGAAVFGEALRAGTPVAALAWRTATCAEVALCADTGKVAIVDPTENDECAAEALASAIEQTSMLRADAVQEIGLARFDPARHFQALAARPA